MNYNIKILDIIGYSIQYTHDHPFWKTSLLQVKEYRNSELMNEIQQYIEKPEHKFKSFEFVSVEREIEDKEKQVWKYFKKVIICQVLNS